MGMSPARRYRTPATVAIGDLRQSGAVRAIDAIGQCAAVEIGQKGGFGMGEFRFQATLRCQGADRAARRETFHQWLASFEMGHHLPQTDLLRLSGQCCAAAAASPCFNVVGTGEGRNHLGQMVSRDAEFLGKLSGREGALGLSRHPHQHAQAIIGERGEAQGRGPDLVIEMRIRQVICAFLIPIRFTPHKDRAAILRKTPR